jgi:hypothetical protein
MGAELELRHPDGLGNEAATLIARMTETVDQLAHMDAGDATATRRDAAIIEAAAQQASARDLEVAAARLRLYAERRLGQLSPMGHLEGFSATQIRDFERLAAIPTKWRHKARAKVTGLDEVVDLFAVCVEHQLQERSHTIYSVYRASLDRGSTRHARYAWLWQAWDGTWVFYYTDPQTKRQRKATYNGDVTGALEYRAILSGKAKPENEVALLPIRGREATDLGVALDNVRRTRTIIGLQWDVLSDEQKRSLDGAYGYLDDLARAIVEAMNL